MLRRLFGFVTHLIFRDFPLAASEVMIVTPRQTDKKRIVPYSIKYD
jgi:hypothetical protein